MRKCWACHKEQPDDYFTRDIVACDDCTPTFEETRRMNYAMACAIFGIEPTELMREDGVTR